MKKYLFIPTTLLVLACGPRQNPEPHLSQKPASADIQVASTNTNQGEPRQNGEQEAKLDQFKVVNLKIGQLEVVVKSVDQMQTQEGRVLHQHYFTSRKANLECSFVAATFDKPKVGQRYKSFSEPFIEKDKKSLELNARIHDFRSAIRQSVSLQCATTNGEAILRLTIGDLKTLFSQSLEIKFLPER